MKYCFYVRTGHLHDILCVPNFLSLPVSDCCLNNLTLKNKYDLQHLLLLLLSFFSEKYSSTSLLRMKCFRGVSRIDIWTAVDFSI